MFLEKLELNGFKSFAQNTTLEFNRGITAIVGPNGSGKSNIAEAIRWVMGEQSAKSLRGKRGIDLIFSGSDKAAQLGLAEVSLCFDNNDKKAPIDYLEFIITRRIHRDSHGDYLLNNQEVRLQDILLLLAQINLSSKTYSVIGQGMVDEILNVSSLERKDFFEEASGVKPLQIKKNLALRKLDHTLENLQTVNIQLNEISPRLRSLTRQVNRLQKRIETDNKLRDLQYHYYGESLNKLKTQRLKLKTKEKNLQNSISGLEGEARELQQVMFSLTKESSHSDKFSRAQKNYQVLIEKKAKFKEEELRIKGELLQTTREIKKTQVPISVVREVESEYQQLTIDFKQLTNQIRTIRSLKEVNIIQDQLTKLFNKFEKLMSPLNSYLKEEDLSRTEKKLKEIKQQVNRADKQLNNIQQQIKELAELEKKEKIKIWQTQNELQVKQKILNDLINERNETMVDLARVETHISDLENEVINEVGHEFLNRISGWQMEHKSNNFNDIEAVKENIHKLKHELELIGGIDPEIQQEHQEIKERYDFLETQTSDLKNSIEKLQQIITELNQTIKEQFYESFRRINKEFQKYFKMLFRGGHGELKLIKENTDLRSVEKIEEVEENKAKESNRAEVIKIKTKQDDEIVGVEISATPPGKKLKSINMLSGGERALTSIALICAIIANNPAPFVVLDEVDAALDEENSLHFAEIVNELSHKTQFIIITHNRATMERADLLYGVTMGDDGISKILSLKLEQAQEYTNR